MGLIIIYGVSYARVCVYVPLSLSSRDWLCAGSSDREARAAIEELILCR